MLLLHFFTPKIAHSSYILAGSQTCAVIDPRRDVQVYIDAAKSLGMRITHVLETHLHADFVSGHLDLARKTGATIYAPKSARCEFDHVPLSEGDEISFEDIVLQVLETPGHTPEHISYVAIDTSRGPEPVGVFCGDTLFVGDVGRPDLFPGRAEELAKALFSSLHDKLMKLPDFCEVLPAHGAGSLCGRAMGAKWRSTIGYERRYNSALQIRELDEFITSLTTNMPPAPDHFSRCSAINGKGPALVSSLPAPKELSPLEFAAEAARENTVVLDLRPYAAFGGQHLVGSYHIDFGGNFPTFAGWIMPPDKNILLVVPEAVQVADVLDWLRRVGVDRVTGALVGSLYAWAAAGLPTDHLRQLSTVELQDKLSEEGGAVLVDVRAPGEYESEHINSAINIPVAELRTRHKELDKSRPVILMCSTGHRSSLGASILLRNGFEKVYNAAGGMTGYLAAGLSTEV
ncbi:MAG: MBL fold metallo-hydrolase [Dehalococcoidia bacterium]|nr:MBL fold metallo-hydrolase [Dehalococcoidia bacterium]